MADLAHEASGPASLEPAGIALQQASGPASTDKGKLRVFISYSRDDLKFADQLDDALVACGFECFIDRHGISGGEEWKQRLGGLIREADTVVFVLSPSSAGSPMCDWEGEEASRLHKRILPVICRPLEGVSPPPRLRELNYTYFYEEPKVPSSGFGNGLARLVIALNTDFDWLREHTRYLQRAMEWEGGGRPTDRLLSGNDILEAKAWAARWPKGAPEPTALHLEFIRASEEEAETRLSEQRKQLEEVAAAQAARETALHDREEALKQAADAQRKRARIRNIALVAVSILAVVAVLFSWLAEQQREQADDILGRALNIIAKLQNEMDIDSKNEAVALFQTGATHGNAASMRNLGISYANGYSVARDYVKAREWLGKAATKGDASAMSNLGALYVNGQGVTQDYAKAREWFEKAAAMGDATGMNNLGTLYDNGLGVAQDYVKARDWYEKAAAKDNVSAMTNLGLLYVNGQGVTQDYAKAREWFEKAAAKGDATAMNGLGVLYENGDGVTQDYAKAREWFEKAAAKGDATAMSNLGVLYEYGYGVAQDYAKEREWLEKAAAKGDTTAMGRLGLLYGEGHGVTKDYAKAREWYEKAADKGDARAMSSLGLFYETGISVTQDYAKAREWYERASAKGDPEVKADLERLTISEAAAAGHYAEALKLQEALEAKQEAAETKWESKPGKETVEALTRVARYALLARDFAKALNVAERAHALLPDDLTIETNRAHALMFLERAKEAKALYLAHKGEQLPDQDNELWEQVIADDFVELRKAGMTHPMMADIEKELGVSR
jgi:uncharacterized protein